MTVNTYYVNSATGSDSNDGSVGSPWLTLPYAFANAAFATSTGIILRLSGTFTVTSPIDATLSTSYPLVNFAVVGPATININHTSSVGLFGHWMYRQGAVIGCTIQCQSTGQISFSGDTAEWIGCEFRSGVSMGLYWIFGAGRFANCTFVGEKTAGTFIQFSAGGRYDRCTFKNINYLYTAATQNTFTHCKFATTAQFSTGLFSVGDGANRNTFAFRNCSFAGFTSPLVESSNQRYQVAVDNCVFQSVGKVSDVDLRIANVYRYGTLAGSHSAFLQSDTVLTQPPYADPMNGDWTLSAELAAIVGSDGFTPGAVQATGGGTARPTHPLLSQVIA